MQATKLIASRPELIRKRSEVQVLAGLAQRQRLKRVPDRRREQIIEETRKDRSC